VPVDPLELRRTGGTLRAVAKVLSARGSPQVAADVAQAVAVYVVGHHFRPGGNQPEELAMEKDLGRSAGWVAEESIPRGIELVGFGLRRVPAVPKNGVRVHRTDERYQSSCERYRDR